MLVISPLTFHWYVANKALEIASNDDDKLLYSNVTSKYSKFRYPLKHWRYSYILSLHIRLLNSSQIPFRSESFIQFPKQS